MKKITLVVPVFLFLLLAPIFPALADPKSDYEFQYSQYRRSYLEFSQLKRDYLTNPTLDNQQKSIIVAKQSLQARDLAKASYARYLTDIITSQQTDYAAFQPVLGRLSEATAFYVEMAQLSQSITTPAQLEEFSDQYIEDTVIHDRSFFYGQVVAKLAQLVRFQLEANSILESIYPSLPVPQPLPLRARLEDIPRQAEDINTRISALSQSVIPEVEEGPLSIDQFFGRPVEFLMDIRTRQSTLVDQLIDIDLNYVQ